MKYKNIVMALIATIGVLAVVKFSTVLANPNIKDVKIESTKGKNEGIFSEKDGMWQPGMSKKSEFFIENSSNKDIVIEKFTFNKSFLKNYKNNKDIFESDKEYDAFMNNSFIEISYKGEELYSGSFKDAFKEKKVDLLEQIKVKAGEKKVFDITISLSKDMNNNAKALKKEFILGIIYEYAEESKLTENKSNYKNIALGSYDIFLELVNENMLTKPLKEEV
ncbi:hypothetical protein [Clostridium tarantellae]|uniref:Uncharacterized protein n=1 Tax=Clostridium tarantellae TaxID=39493 RepID=A0A6I1MPK3_9CLOT|nr:hypothetical protein [Clostridium tarantellae]MPQ44398.1 hypothetical protein [Clostridium tarantellae]